MAREESVQQKGKHPFARISGRIRSLENHNVDHNEKTKRTKKRIHQIEYKEKRGYLAILQHHPQPCKEDSIDHNAHQLPQNFNPTPSQLQILPLDPLPPSQPLPSPLPSSLLCPSPNRNFTRHCPAHHAPPPRLRYRFLVSILAQKEILYMPPVVVSADTSKFPYTFKRGLRSAIRVARVVKEVVDRNEPDVRWWFYIGAIQRAMSRMVLDSCLRRYSHLYGSDARIYSCVAELGIALTHEPGFHQVDLRGALLGLLAAHPLSPLLSLHHLDIVEPLFPRMNNTQALEHLFEAANVDPHRILQQAVCYDRSKALTVSVSWGFAIQVFQGNEFLPDTLPVQRTFTPWNRGRIADAHFMFNLRDYPKDPCRRPTIFFLKSVTTTRKGIWTNYTRHVVGHCFESNPMKQLKQIGVFARKLEPDIEQMKAPRRQCCDVLPNSEESMNINIRQCGTNELISMDH
ncbi:hypothetical protein K1719_046770 [Acacia pycnantha]|nr:hypothetical protein K1719_046770 [Acacia pycnantha]